MHRRLTLAAAALLLVPALGAGAEQLAPGDHVVRLRHGGLDRSALVHVPPQAAAGGPLPVVLSFHGGGGNARDHRDWVAIEPLADREGFLVVVPEGTGAFTDRLHTWNVGACCGWARRHAIDDVGFTIALLDTLGRSAPVDPTRVYATGLSNGAMMAYRVAADRPDRIAAIAPVAGAITVDAAPTSTAVPVMHVHSVDDPRALFAGGEGPLLPFLVRVRHPPIADVIAAWVVRDGCPSVPRADPPVRDAATGHTATRIVYGPCRDGAEVVLWRLTGAGHVWPGAAPRLPWLLGPSSRVIDVNAELWRFFRRFTRPLTATRLPPQDGPWPPSPSARP